MKGRNISSVARLSTPETYLEPYIDPQGLPSRLIYCMKMQDVQSTGDKHRLAVTPAAADTGE